MFVLAPDFSEPLQEAKVGRAGTKNGKIRGMSVKDIEKAITELPRSDVAELSEWFEEFRAQIWNAQIGHDSKTGRFDKLIEEAKVEYASGRCKPL